MVALSTGLPFNNPRQPTGFSLPFFLPTVSAHAVHLRNSYLYHPDLLMLGILLVPMSMALSWLGWWLIRLNHAGHMRRHLALFHIVGCTYIFTMVRSVVTEQKGWVAILGVGALLLLRQIVWARLLLAAVDSANGGINLDAELTTMHELLAFEKKTCGALISQWCPCARTNSRRDA